MQVCDVLRCDAQRTVPELQLCVSVPMLTGACACGPVCWLETAAHLPKTLATLPGGGLTHGVILFVGDQSQAVDLEIIISHQVGVWCGARGMRGPGGVRCVSQATTPSAAAARLPDTPVWLCAAAHHPDCRRIRLMRSSTQRASSSQAQHQWQQQQSRSRRRTVQQLQLQLQLAVAAAGSAGVVMAVTTPTRSRQSQSSQGWQLEPAAVASSRSRSGTRSAVRRTQQQQQAQAQARQMRPWSCLTAGTRGTSFASTDVNVASVRPGCVCVARLAACAAGASSG
jgi:hypothetical protein